MYGSIQYWPFGRWGQFLTWLAAGSWVSQSWCWLAASGDGVPMEGGKPRVFLLCHLDLSDCIFLPHLLHYPWFSLKKFY